MVKRTHRIKQLFLQNSDSKNMFRVIMYDYMAVILQNDLKDMVLNYIYSPENEIDDVQIDKFGFIKDDIIIIATKV